MVKLELPFDNLELEILLKECRYEGNPDFYEYIDDSKRVLLGGENFDTGCTEFVVPMIRRWVKNEDDYARDPLTIIDFLIVIPANPLKRLLADTKGRILVGRPIADSRKHNTFTDLDGESKERLRRETFQNVTTILFCDWRKNAHLWVQDNDFAMAQHGNFNVDIIPNGSESLAFRAHCISPSSYVSDLDKGSGKGSMKRLQIAKPELDRPTVLHRLRTGFRFPELEAPSWSTGEQYPDWPMGCAYGEYDMRKEEGSFRNARFDGRRLIVQIQDEKALIFDFGA